MIPALALFFLVVLSFICLRVLAGAKPLRRRDVTGTFMALSAFLAAADAMLTAENERLTARLDSVCAGCTCPYSPDSPTMSALLQEVDDLKAENAELKAAKDGCEANQDWRLFQRQIAHGLLGYPGLDSPESFGDRSSCLVVPLVLNGHNCLLFPNGPLCDGD